MTALIVRASGRRIGLGIAVVAALIGVAGCEPTSYFFVANGTDEILTVSERTQVPGQPPDPPNVLGGPSTLHPGERTARFSGSLEPGSCLDITVSAYDPTGKLVAQYPSPICIAKHGHAKTWTITISSYGTGVSRGGWIRASEGCARATAAAVRRRRSSPTA